jgi:hypothetical protein
MQRSVGNLSTAMHLQRAVPPLAGVVTYRPATTLQAYLELVIALENVFSDQSPRGLLSLLRTAYYGKPWSVKTTRQWEDVLPSGRGAPDPRPRAGTAPGSLLEALKDSQTVGKTDIGHVLTGLEAMLTPTPSVQLETPLNYATVEMPNVEFATWGGDIGSVAAMRLLDEETGAPDRGLEDYFARNASDSDLEGDVDAYAIRAGAGDIGRALPDTGIAGRKTHR